MAKPQVKLRPGSLATPRCFCTGACSAMSTVCVLVSGGLDSGVLLASVLRDSSSVQPVYVRAGMAWEEVERLWLNRFVRALAAPEMLPIREIELSATDIYGSH